jgi:butyrate kinase
LGRPAYVVDTVSTDELQVLARVTGLQELPRESFCHALNRKAVGRKIAAELEVPYDQARLAVAHLGTGTSRSAQRAGQMIDISDGRNEGAMSADRCVASPMSL